MKVMIDGKNVKCNSEVRVIHETTIWHGCKETEAELHMIISDEGMITDLVIDGEAEKTGWSMIEDIAEECH